MFQTKMNKTDISFLLSYAIVVPSFKNTASVFLEILFIQYFTMF